MELSRFKGAGGVWGWPRLMDALPAVRSALRLSPSKLSWVLLHVSFCPSLPKPPSPGTSHTATQHDQLTLSSTGFFGDGSRSTILKLLSALPRNSYELGLVRDPHATNVHFSPSASRELRSQGHGR